MPHGTSCFGVSLECYMSESCRQNLEEGGTQSGGYCEYSPGPDRCGTLHKVHPLEGPRRLGTTGEAITTAYSKGSTQEFAAAKTCSV